MSEERSIEEIKKELEKFGVKLAPAPKAGEKVFVKAVPLPMETVEKKTITISGQPPQELKLKPEWADKEYLIKKQAVPPAEVTIITLQKCYDKTWKTDEKEEVTRDCEQQTKLFGVEQQCYHVISPPVSAETTKIVNLLACSGSLPAHLLAEFLNINKKTVQDHLTSLQKQEKVKVCDECGTFLGAKLYQLTPKQREELGVTLEWDWWKEFKPEIPRKLPTE